MTFNEFAEQVQQIVQTTGPISSESKLVNDLGLDSLAISELVVGLVVELRIDSLLDDAETRDWTQTTVGDLYDRWRQATAA